ncbi:MAG: DUF1679 domain-containing protein [Crocinitomicaceae bacterium]|nr:DUF1679 domain-containing protein [Crocinitomicaceae bacterium]
MKRRFKEALLTSTGAVDAEEIQMIQELWSGYGKIARMSLSGSEISSVIIKNIVWPSEVNHPRGWNTDVSHQRKVKSYQVEMMWYAKWSHLCDENCRVPKRFVSVSEGEEHFIVLEDLDAAGFPVRKSALTKGEVKVCLDWLANFHATFLNQSPSDLWEIGTYWHLSTRTDEFKTMKDGAIKKMAQQMDAMLTNCEFQTFVHGDAKVANFCFSEDGNRVAAVDFQYVGGGCGMKDVVYLLGSCLDEDACERFEIELLDFYFSALKKAVERKGIEIGFERLENEWRRMYPLAWMDFTRFLLGWMPSHQKINRYSNKMADRVKPLFLID